VTADLEQAHKRIAMLERALGHYRRQPMPLPVGQDAPPPATNVLEQTKAALAKHVTVRLAAESLGIRPLEMRQRIRAFGLVYPTVTTPRPKADTSKLEQALDANRGDVQHTALALGMSSQAVYQRCRYHGIPAGRRWRAKR
jgi:DNA-binding NtrC family response regulator